ncbi:MAG TPA: hypothetical protein VKB48_03565 [Candidatus Acidoferrum sp.]|nr:hypothetical protein [Candidatus Acidoferrum sp.]
MTEERKHAILFATTFLCARKIIDLTDAKEHEKIGKKHWLGVFEKEALESVEAFTEVFARFHKPPTVIRESQLTANHLRFRISPDNDIAIGMMVMARGEEMAGRKSFWTKAGKDISACTAFASAPPASAAS